MKGKWSVIMVGRQGGERSGSGREVEREEEREAHWWRLVRNRERRRDVCACVCERLVWRPSAARDFVQVGARVRRGAVVAAEGNVYGERMQ